MRSTSPRSASARSLSAWLALILLALMPAAARAQRSTPIQITQPGGASNDFFAFTLGIDGDTMVVGCYASNVGPNLDQGSASVYRWTGSGWTFEATLTASDGTGGDLFGVAVAISGDTIVVGALADDVGANFDQGSAYVFTRTGSTWTQQAKLTASDGSSDDAFGYSVAIHGNTIVTSAYADDIGANIDLGSAYVFTRTGSSWTQQAKLTASDGATSDNFGFSVGTDGNSVIVGAYRDDVGANTNQGSAYLFTRTGSAWTQQAKLVASDGAPSDSFGFSVAIDGETAIIGAYTDIVGANTNQGSAYVFTRSGTAWTQQTKLTATEGAAGDLFGAAVSLDGNTAVIGAYGKAIGANTNQGAAYVFTRSGSTWTQQTQLTAPDGAISDRFGVSVAVSGDLALVGAYTDTVGGNSIQGSAWVFSRLNNLWIGQDFFARASDGLTDDRFGYSIDIDGNTAVIGAYNDATTFFGQGSAYVFVRSGTTWTQQAKLIASDGALNDNFGFSVAISGNTALIGAYADDIGANVNQGSAYVFTRSGTTWTQQAKFINSDGAAGDLFGTSVGLDTNTAVIGAYGKAIGANNAQGAAYVFTRTGSSWSEIARLTASDGLANDFFGFAVDLHGNDLIVGAFGDNNGSNTDGGSAYVFSLVNGVWTQQAKLTDPLGNAFDLFGNDVAIRGNLVAVGSPRNATNALTNAGAVALFRRLGSSWTYAGRVSMTSPSASDQFGAAVALEEGFLAAGAAGDNVDANADQGSVTFFDVAASDLPVAHNDTLGLIYPSLSAALLPAQSGHQLTASDAAWRAAGSLNSLGRSLAFLSETSLRTNPASTLELGGASVIASAAGTNVDLLGQLRTAAGSSADLFADRFRLGSRGIMTARTGSSLTINAPTAALDGQTRLEQNASLTFSGSATAIGPTTANLNSSLTAGSTFTNIDTFTITSGTISAPLFLNRDTANIFGTSALFGSYTNDSGAITTIRSGTLFVFGSLTNNGTIVGTICASCAGSPPTLDLTGSLVLGPDANLTMPFQDALVRLGGNFDAAINNHVRYDMAQATLQFEGTGAAQTLEAMSIDRGQDTSALDRTIAGNFPIGTLRVGPTPSLVRTVDARDNDQQGQSTCEAIYVDTLIIDAGSTLDTSACVTIYYTTLINNGTVTDESKLVPIEPCPADFDGSGFLDSDDFVFYLDQFVRGCVAPGEDVFGPNPDCFKSADFDGSTFVDVDDFVAYFAAFNQGC